MSGHELRTDLPTLYAAADAAAAAFAGGGAAAPHALLRSLLQQGMWRVAGGEMQLQPVPYEVVKAALLRAVAADSQLSGFDPHGPALPELLHQLASAGLVRWGGGTAGGKGSSIALRAERLLDLLWRQRAAAGPASAPCSAAPPPGLNRGAPGGGRRSAIPAAFAVLSLTEDSCIIRLDLSPIPDGQAQRTPAIKWLQAAVDCAVPGTSPAACVQRVALNTLLSGLKKAGSWSFRLHAVPAAETSALLLNAFAGHPQMASCYLEQYGADLLSLLREPAASQLVQLVNAGDGQTQVLLRIDRLAQAFMAAEGQPEAELEQSAASAQTPPPAARPPRPASVSLWGSPAAAGSPQHAAGLEWQAQAQTLHVVATEAAAQAAAAQLCDAPKVALAFVWELATSGRGRTAGGSDDVGAAGEAGGGSADVDGGSGGTDPSQGGPWSSRAEVGEVDSGAKGSSDCGGTSTLSHVMLCTPGSGCYAFDLREGGEAVTRQLALVLEREQTTKVLHDARAGCAALLEAHGISCSSLWDTQVAFGLLQYICGLGCPGGAKAAVEPPVDLEPLLSQYGLLPGSPRSAEGSGGRAGTGSLLEDTVDAAAAAAQLLPLKVQLEADLGPAASLRVEHLSRAWAEWRVPPAQRTCAAAASGEQGSGEDSGTGRSGDADEGVEQEGGKDDAAWLGRLLARAALY